MNSPAIWSVPVFLQRLFRNDLNYSPVSPVRQIKSNKSTPTSRMRPFERCRCRVRIPRRVSELPRMFSRLREREREHLATTDAADIIIPPLTSISCLVPRAGSLYQVAAFDKIFPRKMVVKCDILRRDKGIRRWFRNSWSVISNSWFPVDSGVGCAPVGFISCEHLFIRLLVCNYLRWFAAV